MTNIIPTPKRISISDEYVAISATWNSDVAPNVMRTFCDCTDRVWKVRFEKAEDAALNVSYVDDLPKEGYRILVTKDGRAVIAAGLSETFAVEDGYVCETVS